MKNMVSCNAASKATLLSMGSLVLLLRASAFTVLDLNEMGGMMLPREVLGASLSGLVGCGWCRGSPAAVATAKEPCPPPKTTLIPLLEVRP